MTAPPAPGAAGNLRGSLFMVAAMAGFAAEDFLREIKKLGSIFESVRVDGPDYRHRDLPPAPEPTSDAASERG